jgi:2-phosphosulfolactate phosphatase
MAARLKSQRGVTKALRPTASFLGDSVERSVSRAAAADLRRSAAQTEECHLFADQSLYAVRFEWGERGLEAVSSGCSVVVIVDVFSFCTSADVATGRGAAVLPHPGRVGTAARYAEEQRAVLACEYRTTGEYSLSPTSLVGVPAGARLVLPSRNGAALSLRAAGVSTTVAACLRNAAAVADFARARGGPVAVIGSGERWADGSLRPDWEDLVGAGAVIAGLAGTRSPEADAACEVFRGAEADLLGRLRACSSGRELIERGFASDVELAAAVGVSRCVPVLSGKAFVALPW